MGCLRKNSSIFVHLVRNLCFMRFSILFMGLLLPALATAQRYTSYFTGDTADVNTFTSGGIVLAGGASDVDPAMRWFLQQSGGGDIVVLRASGADGYNAYLYRELGVAVNSVETILTPNVTSAQAPYIAQQIRRAEGLWIAGGDQSRYVRFWKDGPVAEAIRYLIHVKKVPVGGISAGMAIQGEAYYAALNGSVTSAEAIGNPFHMDVTLGYQDFLSHPILRHTGIATRLRSRPAASPVLLPVNTPLTSATGVPTAAATGGTGLWLRAAIPSVRWPLRHRHPVFPLLPESVPPRLPQSCRRTPSPILFDSNCPLTSCPPPLPCTMLPVSPGCNTPSSSSRSPTDCPMIAPPGCIMP
jgi:hypothetical protein